MKSEILGKAASLCGKAGFALRKRSPEILVVVGIIGTVASTVLACKATTKANDILEKTKRDLDDIHGCESDKDLNETGEYTEDDARKDKNIVYVQTGIKFAKLYAPAVILGAFSLSCMVGSNVILRKRSAALAAAYATIDAGFKEYRGRVIERFGEQVDKELRYNIKAKEISEQKEDGTEETTTENVADPNEYSMYARIFDETNPEFERDSDRNRFFLTLQQNCFNDKLKARGYVFLNEVYDALGFEQTKAGQIVGWVYKPRDPSHKGDNYIDFGMFDITREKARDFINGYEQAIVLDFNVDGPIIDTFTDVIETY